MPPNPCYELFCSFSSNVCFSCLKNEVEDEVKGLKLMGCLCNLTNTFLVMNLLHFVHKLNVTFLLSDMIYFSLVVHHGCCLRI